NMRTSPDPRSPVPDLDGCYLPPARRIDPDRCGSKLAAPARSWWAGPACRGPRSRPSVRKEVDGLHRIARLNLVTAKVEVRPGSDADLATLVAVLGERHFFTDSLARQQRG